MLAGLPTELILEVLAHVDIRDVRALIDSRCVPSTLFSLTLHHDKPPMHFTNKLLKPRRAGQKKPQRKHLINLIEVYSDDTISDAEKFYKEYANAAVNFIVLSKYESYFGTQDLLYYLIEAQPKNTRILVSDAHKHIHLMRFPYTNDGSLIAFDNLLNLSFGRIVPGMTLNLSRIRCLDFINFGSYDGLVDVDFSLEPFFSLCFSPLMELTRLVGKEIAATNLSVRKLDEIDGLVFLGENLVLDSFGDHVPELFATWLRPPTLRQIKAPNMTTLHVNCHADPVASDLQFTSLKRLKYRSKTIDDSSTFHKLIPNFPALEYLEFDTACCSHMIIHSLEPNSFMALKYLRFKLSRQHLSMKGKTYGTFPSLETLRINCIISTSDAFVPKFIAPKLKDYRLRTRQRHFKVAELAAELEGFPLLERLSIHLRKNGKNVDGVESLEAVLMKLAKTLVYLELYGVYPDLFVASDRFFPKLQTLLLSHNDSLYPHPIFKFKAPVLERLEVKGWHSASSMTVCGLPSLTSVLFNDMAMISDYHLRGLLLLREADLSSCFLSTIEIVNSPQLGHLRWCVEESDDDPNVQVKLKRTGGKTSIERYYVDCYHMAESDPESSDPVDLFDRYEGQEEEIGLRALSGEAKYEGYDADDIEEMMHQRKSGY